MSPQWLDLVKHAAAEAERLGLELGIQQAGGWSNSGGPWIKPEQAMQMVTISETLAKGPGRFNGALKQPETRSGTGYEKPDFQANDGAGIKHIHRTSAEADIYFVSNQEPKSRSVECLFRTSGRQPELWHADTGVIEPASLWCVKDGRTAVTLNLDAEEAVFVVFRRPATAPADPLVALEHTALPISHPAPKLVIHKAIYGALTFEGTTMVDVSHKVRLEVVNGRQVIHLANLGAGDPAGGSPKQTRVAYVMDGKEQMVVGGEGGSAELPQASNGAAPAKFLRAIYGKFDEKQNGVPYSYSEDVTAKLVAHMKDGFLAPEPGAARVWNRQ